MKERRPEKIINEVLLPLVHKAAQARSFRLSDHAWKRVDQRDVDLSEIEHVLLFGRREPKKDEFKGEHDSWAYAFKGKTLDNRWLRISVGIDHLGVVIVTVIALDRSELH